MRQQAAAKRQLSDDLEAACAEAKRSVSAELREAADADADADALAPPHDAPTRAASAAAAGAPHAAARGGGGGASAADEAHGGPRGRDPGLGPLERLLTTLEGVQ